ncbi:MAG TPA: hypothetical protein VGM37_18015 [Armatimonadota bacterium]|jgi:hypothetical protein
MRTRKGFLLAMGCSVAITGAASGKVQHLGRPCRSMNVLAGITVKDPKTGSERLALTNMNENTRCELLFIDFHRNAGTAYRAPAGDGSWALNEVPGRRLVVGTYYDGRFMVFDLEKMAFTREIAFPGEGYIWNQALGKDGRLYGGTYPGGKLGALDLTTYAVEDLGNAAPPNLYLRHVSALPDGRILCHYITDRETTLVFDPDTKKFTPAPGPLGSVAQGVTWNGCFVAERQAFDRDLKPLNPLPFPTPPGKSAWAVSLNLTSAGTLYLQQGSSLYRFRPGEKALTLVADINLNGGEFLAAASDGSVLVLRGQDYAVVRPGDKTLRLKRIPVEAAPRPTHFLRMGPKGRLWGGPTFGQTVFWLDPTTRKYANTGAVSNHGGEVFDAAFVGASAYLVSYAGGEIIRYDTDRPWDQFGHRNPRTIATVAPGYIRPSGGVRLGPDGKLYSGWMARYGTYGGALGITDPASGKTVVVENPLGEQTVCGVAADVSHIYLGTSRDANGLRVKPGESARFGALDLQTHAVTYRREFPGAQSIRALAVDPAAKRLAMLVDGRVTVFDTEKQELVEGLPGAPPASSLDGVAPGDGSYYYGSGKDVMSLDLLSGRATVISALPEAVDHLEVSPSGAVYVSCGVDVYCARAAEEKR